jgi:hypothetical protein
LYKGLKSFVIAVLIIAVITAGGVLGIMQLANLMPKYLPWVQKTTTADAALPSDVPLYKGSVLADSTAHGDRLTFKYMLPLGAQTTVRDWYGAEMPKMGWTQLAADERYLEYYKNGGKRRTMIRVVYENGKAAVSLEITGK